MAHDAFISYSIKDKAIGDAICIALENDGLSCWYAPRDVEIGADWDASIMEALANSRVMILVWSSQSDKSKQVKREVSIALDDVGITLIPFRIEEIVPSKLRYYLGNIQWLDATTPPMEQNLQRLVEHVQTSLRADEESGEQERKEEAAEELTRERSTEEPRGRALSPPQPTDEEAAALRAFEAAHKEFARGHFGEARKQFRLLVDEYPGVSEVTARARTYLAVIEARLRTDAAVKKGSGRK